MTKEEIQQIQEKRKNKTPRERVDYYMSKLSKLELVKKIKQSRKWK
jgi:hypothetical protein